MLGIALPRLVLVMGLGEKPEYRLLLLRALSAAPLPVGVEHEVLNLQRELLAGSGRGPHRFGDPVCCERDAGILAMVAEWLNGVVCGPLVELPDAASLLCLGDCARPFPGQTKPQP